MKVLEVCTSEALGGLELYFIKCCSKLATIKDLEVEAFVKIDSPIHKNLDQNIKNKSLRGNSIITRIRSLNLCIKRFQPDIIHSHVKTDLPAIAICKVLNQRRFTHVHTRQMNLPRKKRDFFHSFVYGKIDLLITITKRLREQVIQNINIDPERVRVLYYGVPEVAGSKVHLPGMEKDKRFRIGLIARIDAKKNQHTLMEALGILNKQGLKASAYLIGKSTDHEYEHHLKEIISKLSLSEQVQMTGFMNNPILLMPNFDVVLLTSEDETFGLVLAEAMRAGVAVIGADGGGVPEIIEHEKTGLLFKPNDPKSLSDQLEKLVSDKGLLQRLAKAGKKSADKKFNEDTHFNTLHQVFQKEILS